jgi:hypothetical protein
MDAKRTKSKTRAKARRTSLSVAPFPDNADHAAAPARNPRQPSAVFRVQGPMSTFGGPHDMGVSPSEGLALFEREDLQNPRHRNLFLPSQPPGTSGLGRRLNPDKFYLALSLGLQCHEQVFHPEHGRSRPECPNRAGRVSSTRRLGT